MKDAGSVRGSGQSSLHRHKAGGGVSVERKPDNSILSNTSSFARPTRRGGCQKSGRHTACACYKKRTAHGVGAGTKCGRHTAWGLLQKRTAHGVCLVHADGTRRVPANKRTAHGVCLLQTADGTRRGGCYIAGGTRRGGCYNVKTYSRVAPTTDDEQPTMNKEIRYGS